MSSFVTLPPNLQRHFQLLTRRFRRMLLLHGTCWVLLVFSLIAALIIWIDATWSLSRWQRVGLSLLWMGGLAYAVRQWIWIPWRTPIQPIALAAAVEVDYPGLNEELLTAIELAESEKSNPLVQEILQEVETRVAKLDFRRAVQIRGLSIFAVLTTMVVVVILTSIIRVDGSSEHLRRFFLASIRREVPPYRINPSAGDTGVRRGKAITLSAHLEPTQPNVVLPNQATLHLRSTSGAEYRFTMSSDQPGVFYAITQTITNDFEYRIETKEAASDWYKLYAIDPVQIVQSEMEIQPPAYAPSFKKTLPGLADLSVLQHSRLIYSLQLDRAPQMIRAEWRPTRKDGSQRTLRIPLSVDADNRCTFQLSAQVDGELQIFVEAEHRVRSDLTAQRIQVREDQPPVFTEVVGLIQKARQTRGSEPLSIRCVVQDDVQIQQIELQYRLNEGPLQILPLDAPGLPASRIGAQTVWNLPALQTGDKLYYRLRATDNRTLDEPRLLPQETYYPYGEDWAELHQAATATPLPEQELFLRKKEIDESLQIIEAALQNSRDRNEQLRQKSDNQEALANEEHEELEQIQERVQRAQINLKELAQEMRLSRYLQRSAQEVQSIAQYPVQQAEEQLALAGKAAGKIDRQGHLETSQKQLQRAIDQIQQLQQHNERLTADQLDRQILQSLTEEQKQLADKTTNATQIKSAQRSQEDLLERLKRLMAHSPSIQQAIDQVLREELWQLAERLERLSRQQQKLTWAMKETTEQVRQPQIQGLLQKQQALRDRITLLMKQTQISSRTAQVRPLQTDSAERALLSLETFRLEDTLTEQEKNALELDRFARQMQVGVRDRLDPLELSRQLHRWYQDWKQRLLKANHTSFQELTEAQWKPFEQELQQIVEELQQLTLPTEKDVLEYRNELQKNLSQIPEQRMTGKLTDEKLDQLEKQLEQLTQQIPSLDRTFLKIKNELGSIRQTQEAIQKQLEPLLKPFEKQDTANRSTRKELASKLGDVLKRQQELADTVQKWVLPTLQTRQERLCVALQQAIEDLKEGRCLDITTSQQAIRRELERLDQNLARQKAVDDKIPDWLQLQGELEQAIDKYIHQKAPFQEISKSQSDLQRELQNGKGEEFPWRMSDVQEAIKRTEQALQSPARTEELLAQILEQGKSLQKLARAANESEADRLAQLTKFSADLSDEMDKSVTKLPNPTTQLEWRRKMNLLLEEARQNYGREDATREKQRVIEFLHNALQATTPDRQARSLKLASESFQTWADKRKANTKPNAVTHQLKNKMPALGLPNRQDVATAHQLAEEQRQLRDSVVQTKQQLSKEIPIPSKNPLQDLIQQQTKITEQLKSLNDPHLKLPQTMSQEMIEQMQLGQIEKALVQGQMLQDQWQKSLASKPDEIIQQQQQINRQLESLKNDFLLAQGQQLQRQGDLQAEGQRLQQEFTLQKQRFAIRNESVKERLQHANQHLEEAIKAMQLSQKAGQKGSSKQSQDAQQLASMALDQSVEQTKSAAMQLQTPPDKTLMESGQALQQSQEQMERSRQHLQQQNLPNAQEAMRKTAQLLQLAVQQLNPTTDQPGQVIPDGPQPGNSGEKIDPLRSEKPLPKWIDLGNKSWGELSGEMQTKLFQEWKTRYGEEYARQIQLYFQQLAEQK